MALLKQGAEYRHVENDRRFIVMWMNPGNYMVMEKRSGKWQFFRVPMIALDGLLNNGGIEEVASGHFVELKSMAL